MFLSRKFLKFILVGGCTWVFATAQMYLYTQVLSIHYALAYALTQLIIVSANFTIVRRWVFQPVGDSVLAQGGKFVAAVILFRVTDWTLFMVLHGILGIRYYIAIFLALSLVFPVKYSVFKLKVFNDKEN